MPHRTTPREQRRAESSEAAKRNIRTNQVQQLWKIRMSISQKTRPKILGGSYSQAWKTDEMLHESRAQPQIYMSTDLGRYEASLPKAASVCGVFRRRQGANIGHPHLTLPTKRMLRNPFGQYTHSDRSCSPLGTVLCPLGTMPCPLGTLCPLGTCILSAAIVQCGPSIICAFAVS